MKLALLILLFSRALPAAGTPADVRCLVVTREASLATVFQPVDGRRIEIPPTEEGRLLSVFQNPSTNWLEMGFGWGRPFHEQPPAREGEKPPETYMHFLKHMGFKPEDQRGKVVLDIGSGFSDAPDVLAREYGADARGVDTIFHGQYGNRDLVRREAEAAKLDLTRRIGASSTNIPVADNSVDTITSIVSYTYLLGTPHAYQQAMAEALRVLKPGGKAYLVGENMSLEPLLQAWNVPFEKTPAGYVITKPKDFKPPSLYDLDAWSAATRKLELERFNRMMEFKRQEKEKWRREREEEERKKKEAQKDT